MVEATDRVMNRVVSPVVSRFYEAEHARHGVQILCNARVQELVARGSSSEAIPDASPGTERVRPCGWRMAVSCRPTSC